MSESQQSVSGETVWRPYYGSLGVACLKRGDEVITIWEAAERLNADHTAAMQLAAKDAQLAEAKRALAEIADWLGPSSSGWAHKAVKIARAALARIEAMEQS